MGYTSTVLNVPVRCALLQIHHCAPAAHTTEAAIWLMTRQFTPSAVMSHD
ncbi:hypothetical protein [Arthrobacter pigmenti]